MSAKKDRMNIQLFLADVLVVDKAQKRYIKINSSKLKLTSFRWPPPAH